MYLGGNRRWVPLSDFLIINFEYIIKKPNYIIALTMSNLPIQGTSSVIKSNTKDSKNYTQ